MTRASGSKRSPNAEVEHFGNKVRELREERGLTQKQLAETLGMHVKTVGHIENGRRELGISKVWPIARALGVTPAELFGEGWS